MEWVALILLLILWRVHASRLNSLERQLRDLRDERAFLEDAVRQLTRRVWSLEHPSPPTEAVPTVAPEPVLETPVPETPAPRPQVPVYEPAAPPPALEPSWGERIGRRFRGGQWEAIIGGSWLNALGVLILVIALSLFLGYALTQFGPAGKIAIGLSVSSAMLVSGVIVEQRPRYVAFGRGLLSGGWAGLYFTVYAMHAVAAARVFDNRVLAGLLLLAVACGMIVHSLRYRSRSLTLLAFFTAYLALQLGPVSWLAVAASAPLAIALLTISRELEWTDVPIAGMLLTYFTFAFRYDPGLLSPEAGVAALYAYWLCFEIYGLLCAQWAAARSLAELSLFPLNALLLVGTAMLSLPSSTPVASSNFLLSAGILLLISLALRMRWKAAILPDRSRLADSLIVSHRVVIGFVAALFAGALLRRFSGSRAVVGLLLEGQLLILAGPHLGERFFAHAGAAVFALAVAGLSLLGGMNTTADLGVWRTKTWTLFALWMPLQFFFNRRLLGFGAYYTWAGTLLLMAATADILPLEWTGAVWLGIALLLAELEGPARWDELQSQSHLVGLLGFLACGASIMESSPASAWKNAALAGAGAAILYAGAWRRGFQQWSSHAACVLGTLLAMGALWRGLPAAIVAPAWGLLALILLEAGLGTGESTLRRLAHAVALSGFTRVFLANLPLLPETAGVSHRIFTVGPLILLALLHWRRTPERGIVDSFARRGYLYWAVALAAALVRVELGRTLTVLGWAALMLVLLEASLRYRLADARYLAYALAAMTFARGWATNFASVDTLLGMPQRIAMGAVVIAAFHAAQFRLPADDRRARPAFALLGSSLLGILLAYEVSGRMLTIAWGIQAVAALTAGFAAGERVLRLTGLALFLICVVKLFGYDLRELSTLSRIFSFGALGLTLVAASWLYMRFRDKI
jgi:hypothetical protein